MELKPLGAGDLRECLQIDSGECLAQQERDLAARENVHAFTGIEIEHDGGWPVDPRDAMQEWMNFEVGEGGAPGKRRYIVDDDVVDVWSAGAARHRKLLHPFGCEGWSILLIEELSLRAVGITLQRDGAVFQMWQQV